LDDGKKVIKDASSINVGTLLSTDKDFTFQVPRYQREYSWGKDQWSDLFDDFMQAESTDSHFIGSIICIDKSSGALKHNVLEVVDGQQRLTTLTILLARLYNELYERKDSFKDDENANADYVNLRRTVVGSTGEPRLRPQEQGQNSDDFLVALKRSRFEISAPTGTNFGNRRLGKAVKYFDSRIQQRIQEFESDNKSGLAAINDLITRVKSATFVLIEVNSHADAFVLFETLNNRGLSLTPIDLIKNQLLERTGKTLGVDATYEKWKDWLANIGTEYRDQERFFRQFYNAFKFQWDLTVKNAPVATRSKLITIYEGIVEKGFESFSHRMDTATKHYGTIIGNPGFEAEYAPLRKTLLDLSRVEGAPAYMLLLSLFVNRDEWNLTDKDLTEVAKTLVSFFVRRNLTQTPPTYALDRLFISIIESWNSDSVLSLKVFRDKIVGASSSAEIFEEKLREGIYEENTGITRFVLAALEESKMNKEIHVDLWAQESVKGDKQRYVWTIEHVIPQGKNLPSSWISMLGGSELAAEFQEEKVHSLGNLTLSGYNSSLSNLSFEEKRDRVSKNNSGIELPVGYKNGLALNSKLAAASAWNQKDVELRTNELVVEVLELFKL
jgi:hypothetical protein